MMAEESVQLAETFVVTGKTHIQQFFFPAEFYPRNGFDPLIRTNLYKLHDPCGVIDIRKRQGLHSAAYSFIHELFNRHRAVTQGII